MSSFEYTHTYLLDKPHFQECYSQSVPENRALTIYTKSALLALAGLLFLLFSESNAYVAWFLVGLGVLDAVSIYYQKPWWVMRQMLGKASGSEVTLTIDSQGIKNHSHYVKNILLWQDITEVSPTELGLLIVHSQGKNYLSKSVLSEEAYQYILMTHKAK